MTKTTLESGDTCLLSVEEVKDDIRYYYRETYKAIGKIYEFHHQEFVGWKVSKTPLIVERLKEEGRLDEDLYREFNVLYSKRISQDNKDLPKIEGNSEEENLAALVALRGELISYLGKLKGILASFKKK